MENKKQSGFATIAKPTLILTAICTIVTMLLAMTNMFTVDKIAANAAQSAAGKTKKFAAIAKANFNILAEEEKVKKAQLELGKVYYKNFIPGEDTDLAECLPLCEKITESLKLIESLKAEIEQARGGAAPEAPVQDDFNIEEVPAEEAPAEEPVIPEIVVVEDETPEAPEESAE